MYTMQHDYCLSKTSRWQNALHMALFLLLLLIWYSSLTVWLTVLCSGAAWLLWWRWRQQPRVCRVAQLDGDLWTLQWTKAPTAWQTGSLKSLLLVLQAQRQSKTLVQAAPHRHSKAPFGGQLSRCMSSHMQQHSVPWQQQAQLQQVYDHGLYVVLVFAAQQNVIIWLDQVPREAWQQLKVLSKTH